MEWINAKIAEYYSWLKDNTAIREDKGTGWYAISTPFAGLFNDNIEIFIKKISDEEIILSDDGETLSSLKLSGVNIDRPKRQAYIESIANNYGVCIDGDEITSTSNGADFAKKKHSLISAIMSISDMSVLSGNNVMSLFQEDVKSYLDEIQSLYTPSFIVRGKSGLDFCFDFLLPGRKSETVVKSFNGLRKNNVESFLFCLNDTKETRQKVSGKEFCPLAIVNDTASKPQENLINALKNYDTEVIMWSEKEKYADRLLEIA